MRAMRLLAEDGRAVAPGHDAIGGGGIFRRRRPGLRGRRPGSGGHRRRTSRRASTARRRSRCCRPTGTRRRRCARPRARPAAVSAACSRAPGRGSPSATGFAGLAGGADVKRRGHRRPVRLAKGAWAREGARTTAAIITGRGTPRPPVTVIALAGLPACGFGACAPRLPAFPTLRSVALGPLRSRSRGRLRLGASEPCRIPSSPVINRNQRPPTCGRGPRLVKDKTDHDRRRNRHPPAEADLARHAAKMAKKKAARDKIMAGKEGEKGLIIVHTGAGKGKSSCGFGMILRCVAHGMPCAVVQFIKGAWDTGERRLITDAFRRPLPVSRDGRGLHLGNPGQGARHRGGAGGVGEGEGADPRPGDPHGAAGRDQHRAALRLSGSRPRCWPSCATEKPPLTHVVLTGRNAKEALIEAADLVTEMTLVKHPFRSGIKAPAGGGVLSLRPSRR